MNQILYDPTGETNSVFRKPQSLPANLLDDNVLLFDISKPRSKEFLDYFEENLRQKGLVPKRAAKPTNAKTATQEVIDFMVKEADVVVGALSDLGSCTSCGLHDFNELDKKRDPWSVPGHRRVPGCGFHPVQGIGI